MLYKMIHVLLWRCHLLSLHKIFIISEATSFYLFCRVERGERTGVACCSLRLLRAGPDCDFTTLGPTGATGATGVNGVNGATQRHPSQESLQLM